MTSAEEVERYFGVKGNKTSGANKLVCETTEHKSLRRFSNCTHFFQYFRLFKHLTVSFNLFLTSSQSQPSKFSAFFDFVFLVNNRLSTAPPQLLVVLHKMMHRGYATKDGTSQHRRSTENSVRLHIRFKCRATPNPSIKQGAWPCFHTEGKWKRGVTTFYFPSLFLVPKSVWSLVSFKSKVVS